MNPPYGFFLFSVAFFGFMAVVSVVQAHRKKEKTYYVSAMVCFVVLVAFIFFFLNQSILGLTIMISTGILSFVLLPKMLKVRERELTKRLQETDFSAPLRKRYFLSDIWWLKLASKWGLGKAMCLFCIVSMLPSGGILFILSTVYSFITIEYVLVYAPIFSILFTFMYYRQFKKALKRSAGGTI